MNSHSASSSHRASTSISRYADSRARTQGALALALWLLLLATTVAACRYSDTLRAASWILAAWTIASVAWVFFVLPMAELRSLRARGIEYSVDARQYPRLKTLLVKGSGNLGVREPAAYIRKNTPSRTADCSIRIAGFAPYFMVVGQGATRDYQPPELDCLALRGLVHSLLGNVARLDALHRFGAMTFVHRVLVAPVAIYLLMLRALWLSRAEQNADRLTLLLVKNPRLLLNALTKDFVATHSRLRARGVSFGDVETFVKDGGLANHDLPNHDLSNQKLSNQKLSNRDGEQSAHGVLRKAIDEDVAFSVRARNLTRWVNSPQYVSALETLSQK